MLPIHVINLDRAPERLAAISDQLDEFGLNWRRVPAIDGKVVPQAELLARFGGGGWRGRAYPATRGDMACSLTHRQVWEEIAGAASEAAVVLEDDATLAATFPQFVTADTVALMQKHGMGALKLEFWPGPQKSRRFPLGQWLGPAPGGGQIYSLRSGFLGTCGYILTARAAAALLMRFPALDMPVDHFLFGRSAARGFNVINPGFVNPAPVLHDIARFGSDINEDRRDERRSFLRRLSDLRAEQRQAAELRIGKAAPVDMRFAG